MARLTKTLLLAAVALYGQLHTSGKSEEEVKAEIAKDENEYSDEQIDKIYAAILNPDAEDDNSQKNGVFEVIKEFRDKDNFDKIHEVGSDVSAFDSDRLEKLIELGLVEEK